MSGRQLSSTDFRLGGQIGIGYPSDHPNDYSGTVPSYSGQNLSARFSQSTNTFAIGGGYNKRIGTLICQGGTGGRSGVQCFYPQVPNNTDATGTWRKINSTNFANDLLLYCYFYVTTGTGNNQTDSEAAGAVALVDGLNLYSSVYDTSTLGTDVFGIGGTNHFALFNHSTQYTPYCAGAQEVLNWHRLGSPSTISMSYSTSYGKAFYGLYEDRFHSYNVTGGSGNGGVTNSTLPYTILRDYSYLHAYFN